MTVSRRFVLGGLIALFPTAAFAEWKAEYAEVPSAIREWYESQELSSATQKRLRVTWNSCCSHGDVVQNTRFEVDRTTGDDVWKYQLPDGSWKEVPPDTIKWGQHAPNGKATLFKNASHGELCFFPPLEGN